MYFDAHLHTINENEILNAHKKNINGFIINATKEEEWDQVISLSKKYDFCHSAIGIHPWFISTITNNWEEKMELLLQNNPSLTIGEIGLDGFKENKEKQMEIFLKSLNLAKKYKRCVHIHVVKSWNLILQNIKNYPEIPFLFHKFNGTKEIVHELKKYNSWYSVSCEKNVNFLPIDKVLTETDSEKQYYNIDKIFYLVDNFPINQNQLKKNFCNFLSKNNLG